MDLPAIINQMKNHPDFSKAGMVLYHNGVVRDSSRDGRPVSGLVVAVDQEKLDRIIDQTRAMPGIVEVLVHINSDAPLMVGDDVMFLAVAAMAAFVLIFDLAFDPSLNKFIFDPDADNWRRKTVR